MDQLLSVAHINDDRLQDALTTIGEEAIRLSEPCYVPHYGEYYAELLDACGLSKEDVQDFVERTWGGRKEEKWKKTTDETTLFFVWLMWYCLNRGDQATFKSVLISHMIRQYGNLFHKYFSTLCNPGVFLSALQNLSKLHLFSREGTIPSAIYYLSNEVEKKFAEGIRGWNLDYISAFITESRGRLNQSMKSFADAYYKSHGTLKWKGSPQEETDTSAERAYTLRDPVTLSSQVAEQICIKGHIDQPAIDYASRLTGIRKSTATALINDLSNGTTSQRYLNDVSLILQLFLKDLPSIREICGLNYFDHLTQLMAGKRTIKPVYFKQKVQALLLTLSSQIGFDNTLNNMTHQSMFNISKFIAYYITMVLRHLYCP